MLLTEEQKYVNRVLGDCSFCHNPIYDNPMFFTNLDINSSQVYHQKCFEKERELAEIMVDALKSIKELESYGK